MAEDFKEWKQLYNVDRYGAEEKEYRCWSCGNLVASRMGITDRDGVVVICPHCSKPTYIDSNDNQYPGAPYGEDVDNLPSDINRLYNESRECIKHSLYNSSVLTARKILMHVAVERGAKDNLSFAQYVSYLNDKNYLPPNGEAWVDRIRQKGNEANHEIPSMDQDDAEELVKFLEMLLRFVYELPGAISEPPQQ